MAITEVGDMQGVGAGGRGGLEDVPHSPPPPTPPPHTPHTPALQQNFPGQAPSIPADTSLQGVSFLRVRKRTGGDCLPGSSQLSETITLWVAIFAL